MLLVSDFLKSKSLQDLEKEHGVKSRVCNHKFSLNYDQIHSCESDKLAKQCRGVILTPSDTNLVPVPTDVPLGDTRILARPFDRFFNLGQAHADKVNLDHPATAFYEKIDGTLCIVYYDDVKEEWCVATRSVPEANLPVDGFGEFTFRTLFEKALLETVNKDFQTWTSGHLFRDTTYMFELTTPLNKIVVEYEGYGITLLGARKTYPGNEIDPAFVQAQVKTPVATRYRFSSLEEMTNFVSECDPSKHEGIVVCDNKFNRIKVKNPGYLALNKIRDSVLNSPRGIVELILLEKLDDTLTLLPENIRKKAQELEVSFNELLKNHQKIYDECMEIANKEAPIFNENSPSLNREHRKVFALSVKEKNGWLPPMMEQYQGRVSNLTDWFERKRNPDGNWSNNFLDMLLMRLE